MAGRELGHKRPDLAKAVRHLEEAVAAYPSFAEAWERLGRTRFDLGDVRGAEQAFRAGIAADPMYPYTYLPLAALHLTVAQADQNRERVVEAARLCDRVLALHPQLGLAHYYRATAQTALGDTAKAEQSIRAVIAGDGDRLYPGVHALLGEIRAVEGDVPSAVVEYRRFLELEPHSPAAEQVRARLAEWQASGRIR